MRRLLPIGRTFFALALICLGAEHFIFGTFVTGRAPAWPETIPGGTIWTYLTGLAFIAIGFTTIAGRNVRFAALLAAALIGAWALFRHKPVVATEAFLSGAWTRAGKAQPLAERRPFHQLEDQGAHAVGFLDPVNCRDVRGIERGQHAGFTLEARQPLGVIRHLGWEDLQHDVALQLRVTGAIYTSPMPPAPIAETTS